MNENQSPFSGRVLIVALDGWTDAGASASSAASYLRERMNCEQLISIDDQDYFERGIELAIESDGLRFKAIDISDLYAVEIDFAEDLDRANELF